MTGRLEGRSALVTGAATGMGRATAELFKREGASLVLFGLGDATLDAAAAATGGVAVHGSVTDDADITRAVEACGGRLDILVNAAGIILPDTPESVSDEVWERSFAVNRTSRTSTEPAGAAARSRRARTGLSGVPPSPFREMGIRYLRTSRSLPRNLPGLIR